MVIKNRFLTAEISTVGAELRSLRSADGVEYLWQGDPRYWEDRAPVLFPWVGRLADGKYRHHGKIYEMGIHGFAWKSRFVCTEQLENSLTMTLEANPETKAQYPFEFRFSVTYTLEVDTLRITYAVENTGDETMYFAWGGHPGFRVPFVDGETIEDYTLEFSQPCDPDRILFSENVLVSGQTVRYPLEDGRRVWLNHRLFDNFVVCLTHVARSVTLRSHVCGRGVCVSYPDMPYLGFWHVAKTDAPYVCIEPWSALPAREGVLEELSCRSDLLKAVAGEKKQNTWTIRVL